LEFTREVLKHSQRFMPIFITLFLALGCLAFDLYTPLCTGQWGLYLIPLLISPQARQPKYPLWFAAFCMMCVVAGGVFSPPGVQLKWAVISRCIGLLALLLTAMLLTQRKQVEGTLRQNKEAMALSNWRLGLIAKATGSVVGAEPLNREGRKLAEQAMTAFGVDGCVIRSLEGDELKLIASAGVPEVLLQPGIPIGTGFSYGVMSRGRPLFVPDAANHPGLTPFIQKLPPEHRFASYAGAPLLVEGRSVGILGLYARSKASMESFSEADLEHLQIMANHIAVAIANDRLFKEVRIQKDRLAEQVAERQRAETALGETKERLQSLSRRLLDTQETERRHIARELHDEIGQALTALKINLQALQRSPEPGTAATRLLDSINIVDRTLRQVRNLSLDLRPSMLDDFGLCAALRWYADQQAQRAGLQVQFVAPSLEGRLEPTLETACFRVAQEALTNIVRHARASSVRVELAEEAGSLHLMVRDDGAGFEPESIRRQLDGDASLGLLGMKERASLMGGRVELKSAPGQGTEVHGWFPITPVAPATSAVAELAANLEMVSI
jgi:signal transduction histidine kinase